MSSVIQDQSTKIAVRTRSTFDLSRDVLNTTDFGKILPIFCEDMVPTDNLDINVDNFIRLAPMVLPTYGRMRVFMNFFFVPNRLLIENWEEMIQGGASGTYPENFPYFDPRQVVTDYFHIIDPPEEAPNPTDATHMKLWRRMRDIAQFMQSFYGSRIAKTLPISPDGVTSWSEYIEDYFYSSDSIEDLPTPEPIQAYNRIWVEYFSAIDLSESDTLEKLYSPKLEGSLDFSTALDDNIMPSDFFNMKQACYKKDLFTTAFYRPQRGGMTLVPVDMVSSFQPHFAVHGDNLGTFDMFGVDETSSGDAGFVVTQDTAGSRIDLDGYQFNNANFGAFNFQWNTTLSPQAGKSSVIGEFSTYTQRYADAIQRVKERNNIAGARYFDVILARFGIKLEAVRLDRAEYIGSDAFTIQIGDITSTSDTEAQGGSYLGQQAGKAIGSGSMHLNYTAKDYGWLIGVMHILPDTQGSIQGLEKKFTRRSREDYFTPELEDTGMQPIHNQEIFLSWEDSATNQGVFGYAPRYSEYKYANDLVAGDYCIKDVNAVYGDGDAWHMHRIFEDLPTLSTEFVTVGVNSDGLDRIFQQATDGSQDHFYPWIHFSVKANRPMMGFADSALAFANEQGSGKINLPYSGTRL